MPENASPAASPSPQCKLIVGAWRRRFVAAEEVPPAPQAFQPCASRLPAGDYKICWLGFIA